MKNHSKHPWVRYQIFDYGIYYLEKYCAVKLILQNTSKVIEQLNEVFPLENSRHLRRIKKIIDRGKI